MCSKIRKKVGISMSCMKHERYQTIQTTPKKNSPKNIDLFLRKKLQFFADSTSLLL